MQSQVKYGLSSTRIHQNQHTAVKSSYQQRTPSSSYGTPNLKSHSRCTSKIQQARESINLMINQMTSKRNSNNEAVEYVRSVNADALGALQGGGIKTSNRGNNKRENPRGNIHNRTYSNQNNFDDRKGSADFKFDQNEYQDVSPIVPRQINLEQENIQLRRALDFQVRENNDLMRRIRYLQAQNAQLRCQLGQNQNRQKNMRSTQHNSVYDYTSQPYSARNQRQNERNVHYGHNKQRSNFGGNMNNNGNNIANSFGRIPNSAGNLNNRSENGLLAELDVLKLENERLRHEAVDLLKHY